MTLADYMRDPGFQAIVAAHWFLHLGAAFLIHYHS
jgi:hypothetical protein